ncbi:MAG: hypothetical protein IPO78_17375 [Saprospiraceae bacterium]|nr:hypothetical protein [Saprospiraceae bacterium]
MTQEVFKQAEKLQTLISVIKKDVSCIEKCNKISFWTGDSFVKLTSGDVGFADAKINTIEALLKRQRFHEAEFAAL